jgi:hypothetical protein
MPVFGTGGVEGGRRAAAALFGGSSTGLEGGVGAGVREGAGRPPTLEGTGTVGGGGSIAGAG